MMNNDQNKDNSQRKPGGFGGRGPRRGGRPEREKSEFDSNILDLARVTRVTKGGKQLSFRALVIVGDRRGRVGFGLEKGKDVQIGVDKATRQAKKHLIKVTTHNETITHRVIFKYKAAVVMLAPAPKGSGIIAGGAVRAVLELAGVPNITSKILGHTKNKIAIVKATFGALEQLFPARQTGSATAMTPKISVPATASEPVKKIAKSTAKTK